MLDYASHLPPVLDEDVAAAALGGLRATRKTLPPKLFYDDEGCRLFGEITRLPEYYPTRTEMALLRRVAPEIGAMVMPGTALIEYGGSDEAKAAILLDAGSRFTAYVPIDVAGGALEALAVRLARSRPALGVYPVTGDFLEPVQLPAAVDGRPLLGFFPGSTVGNLDRAQARAFLDAARQTLGFGSSFLVGVDLRKAPDLLVPAYDDSRGVTAQFNLNLLRRLNREAAADFDVDAFDHRALWNDRESRVEMHLVSRCAQVAHVAGETIAFAEGETIHTENSHKYSVADFRALAVSAGWTPRRVWTDSNQLFSLHLLDPAR